MSVVRARKVRGLEASQGQFGRPGDVCAFEVSLARSEFRLEETLLMDEFRETLVTPVLNMKLSKEKGLIGLICGLVCAPRK